jgi:fumarate reductase subunit D
MENLTNENPMAEKRDNKVLFSAKFTKRALIGAVLCLLVGIILVIMGLNVLWADDYSILLYGIVLTVISVFYLIYIVTYLKSSYITCTADYFNGRVRRKSITVTYDKITIDKKQNFAGRLWHVGTLIVYVGGVKYRYDYIKDIDVLIAKIDQQRQEYYKKIAGNNAV